MASGTLDLRRELPRYPVFEAYGKITFSTDSTPGSTLNVPFDWHQRAIMMSEVVPGEKTVGSL